MSDAPIDLSKPQSVEVLSAAAINMARSIVGHGANIGFIFITQYGEAVAGTEGKMMGGEVLSSMVRSDDELAATLNTVHHKLMTSNAARFVCIAEMAGVTLNVGEPIPRDPMSRKDKFHVLVVTTVETQPKRAVTVKLMRIDREARAVLDSDEFLDKIDSSRDVLNSWPVTKLLDPNRVDLPTDQSAMVVSPEEPDKTVQPGTTRH